jgi:EpsI family protein
MLLMQISARPWAILAAAIVLAFAVWLIKLGQEVQAQTLQQPLLKLDKTLGQWHAVGNDQIMDVGSKNLLKPQDYLLRNYRGPDGRISALFVAYFGLQREKQMIHSPKQCLPGGGWQIKSREKIIVPGPNGGWQVNRFVLASKLNRLSVLYWFQGRDRIESNEYLARLQLITDGLFLNRNDGALVRITTALGNSNQAVLAGQIELAKSLIPAIEKLMPDH